MEFQRNKVLLLDCQYLVGNHGEVFIKEIAFMHGDSISPLVCYLKPPYDKNLLMPKALKQVNFCEKYIHMLSWSGGDVEYNNLYTILDYIRRLDVEVIFVKGLDKVGFFQKFLGQKVREIEMAGRLQDYPSYRHYCKYHDFNFHRCSINHVFQMFVHLETNKCLK